MEKISFSTAFNQARNEQSKIRFSNEANSFASILANTQQMMETRQFGAVLNKLPELKPAVFFAAESGNSASQTAAAGGATGWQGVAASSQAAAASEINDNNLQNHAKQVLADVQAKAASILLEAMDDGAMQRMKKASSFLHHDEPHISDELLRNHALAFAKVAPEDKSALFELANSHKSRFSPEELAKLKEQTDAFEAFFIKSMLDISMPRRDNPLFGKDAGDEIYRDMHHDAIARSLAGGMGLSQLLYEYLAQD